MRLKVADDKPRPFGRQVIRIPPGIPSSLASSIAFLTASMFAALLAVPPVTRTSLV